MAKRELQYKTMWEKLKAVILYSRRDWKADELSETMEKLEAEGQSDD